MNAHLYVNWVAMIKNARGWQVTRGFIFVHNQPISAKKCVKNLDVKTYVGDSSVILHTFSMTAINLIFAIKLVSIVIRCVSLKSIFPMIFIIAMLRNVWWTVFYVMAAIAPQNNIIMKITHKLSQLCIKIHKLTNGKKRRDLCIFVIRNIHVSKIVKKMEYAIIPIQPIRENGLKITYKSNTLMKYKKRREESAR